MWLADCSIVDVRDGSIRANAAIELENGRISRIEDGPPPPGTEQMDLKGRTILPGLFSCHVHLSVVYPFSATDESESPALTALRAYQRMREALYAGFTTIRCVHEQWGVDLHLRTAIQKGWIEGPRILGAGRALTTTGGHGTGVGPVIADGPDGFLRAARQELEQGADHIKVFITGGLAKGFKERFDVAQMTPDEMRAVVRATRERKGYVVAHAGSSEAIQEAMDAGIMAFEHGYLLDDTTVARMAREKAFLTPTLVAISSAEWMRDKGFEELTIDAIVKTHPRHIESIGRAIDAGVTMINGTDWPPGDPCDGTTVAIREMELMVEAGMTPLQSIQAATVNAAKLCGLSDEVGVVEPGMAADLVAVNGDPTKDISAMRNIEAVLQAGSLVRADPPLA